MRFSTFAFFVTVTIDMLSKELLARLSTVKQFLRVSSSSSNAPKINCVSCYYWSGKVGNKSSDLICAVAIPQATEKELDVKLFTLATTAKILNLVTGINSNKNPLIDKRVKVC